LLLLLAASALLPALLLLVELLLKRAQAGVIRRFLQAALYKPARLRALFVDVVPGGAVKERVGACVGGAGGWLCDGAPGHQGGGEGGEKEKGEAGHERSKTLESEGRRHAPIRASRVPSPPTSRRRGCRSGRPPRCGE
jgi:hypothetical protein